MSAAVALLALAAVGSLAAEFGYPLAAETARILHRIEFVALAGLVLAPVLDLLFSRARSEVLLHRWFHFLLGGAFLMAVGLAMASGSSDPGRWILRAAQVAIVLELGIRAVEVNRLLASLRVPPALLFLGSFLVLIGVGTVLLLLPSATAPGRTTTFTDALFTATSGVCVTGLVVVDTGTHWSPFGRYVILALVQLGGLGLMTFGSVVAILVWRGMRVRESVVMREVVTSEVLSEVGRVIIFILLTTLAVEAAGALALMGLWDHTAASPTVTLGDRIEYSVFHSVAAFCNAGFSLYERNLMDYASAWQVTIVFPLLIIVGGLGFMVLYNLARVFKYRVLLRGGGALVKRRLRLQPKLALVTTAALLAAGTGLVFVFESASARSAGEGRPQAPGGPSEAAATLRGAVGEPPRLPLDAPAAAPPGARRWTDRLRDAWFLAVTARTAGFNTTDTASLAPSTKFLVVLLMFIGASPGSTGGGIKTVTLSVILIGVWSGLRGYTRAEALKRTIAPDIVIRALTVLAVAVAWVSLVSLVLAAWGMRPGATYTFLDVLFETTSAFGTVGLSTGTTPLLNTFGRVLVLTTMYVGRVGPLTLFVAVPSREARERYDYPTEKVAIS